MARKSGKLYEMSVQERIKTCLDTWIHQTGMVRDDTTSGSTATTETEKAVNAMSTDQLFDRLQKATGLSYAEDRLQRLKQTAQEIYDIRSRQNNTLSASSTNNKQIYSRVLILFLYRVVINLW